MQCRHQVVDFLEVEVDEGVHQVWRREHEYGLAREVDVVFDLAV